MIHRVVFGSIERFIGILIEHYAGKFPLWISPVQARVLSLSEECNGFAREVQALLRDKGIRCEIDERYEKIGYKIREAQVQKIPYMLIVGEKELADKTVTVRSRNEETNGKTLRPEELAELMAAEIRERR